MFGASPQRLKLQRMLMAMQKNPALAAAANAPPSPAPSMAPPAPQPATSHGLASPARSPFGAGPAARMMAAPKPFMGKQQDGAVAPPAASAPPTAAPAPPRHPMNAAPPAALDDDLVITGRQPPPYDDPMAMERALRRFEPSLSWAERVQLAGATLQQMGDPNNQIATLHDAITARQREAFTAEQTAESRAAMIQAVRTIASRNRDAYERRIDAMDPEEADRMPRWEATPMAQVLQLAQTPEQFLEWYTRWVDSEADRALTGRGLDIEERGVDARISQGDRELDLRERFGDAEADLGRRRLAVDWFNAETQRDLAEASAGGRDPWARAMMQGDVDRIQQYQEQADGAAALGQEARRMLSLLDDPDEPLNTGALFSDRWAVGDSRTETWRSINSALFPVLAERIAGVLSESDAARVVEGQPALGKDEDTNREILVGWIRAGDRGVERAHWARIYGARDRSLNTFDPLWRRYSTEVSIYGDDPRDFGQWLRDQGLAPPTPEEAGARR